jgi:enamine deaminase RidA (YjgF/YER057c/UK114 family)
MERSVQVKTRRIEADGVAELFITAMPSLHIPEGRQVQELFRAVQGILKAQDVRILQERVFGTVEVLRAVRPIRAEAYGEFDDGVEPAWLVVGEGLGGGFAGVQVHALGGCGNPEVLCAEGRPCGRVVRGRNMGYLTLSGISAPAGRSCAEQARRMFENAEAILRSAGADMSNVARTWIWLDDILGWYDEFNRVRTRFFTERGLVHNGPDDRMPASTGIGVTAAGASCCAMDLVAVLQAGAVRYYSAGGNQPSPICYGSAFSRATEVHSPAAVTAFVSGTASVGPDGETMYPGEAEAQIRATIENIRAVLQELDFGDGEVVQAISYCKDLQAEELFLARCDDLGWPALMVIADVCRPELVFEMEVTAAHRSAAPG